MLDAMNAELAQWQELCKKHEQELAKRRETSDQAMSVLNNELQEIEDQVQSQTPYVRY